MTAAVMSPYVHAEDSRWSAFCRDDDELRQQRDERGLDEHDDGEVPAKHVAHLGRDQRGQNPPDEQVAQCLHETVRHLPRPECLTSWK
jgi:hypothetical protein